MKIIYYNTKVRGNIGNGDTLLPFQPLVSDGGLLSIAYIEGYLAPNANDKRIKVVRADSPGNEVLVDTGSVLNGGTGELMFSLVLTQNGNWTRIDFRISDHPFTVQDMKKNGTSNVKITISGEADNDVIIGRMIAFSLADVPDLPAGITD